LLQCWRQRKVGDAIESDRCCFKSSADRRLLRFELITGAYALQTPAPVGFDRRGALLTTVCDANACG
jgi:hypothetical protein